MVFRAKAQSFGRLVNLERTNPVGITPQNNAVVKGQAHRRYLKFEGNRECLYAIKEPVYMTSATWQLAIMEG